MASRAAPSLRPASSAARPSITVSTRLLRADRPATCGKARGAGLSPSSSTTASTSAAGKAMRRPARRAINSSSAMFPPFRGSEGADQGGTVVAIDAAFPVRGSAEADDIGFGRDLLVFQRDGDIRRLAGPPDPVAQPLDQGPQHVINPGIALRQRADRGCSLTGAGVGVKGKQPVRIDQLNRRAVD